MSPVAFPVTAVPGFALSPANAGAPQIVQLYQVDTNSPERIEAVYMTLAYGGVEPQFQAFSLQLWDRSGVVIYDQPTPVFTAVDSSDLLMTLGWSRLGNDSAQEPFAVLNDTVSGSSRAWANMRLPDLVLQPRSTVQFLSYSDFETMAGTIPVSDCSVTTTPNAGAVSSTTAVDTDPLLLPLADS